jgi:hypothetical protein
MIKILFLICISLILGCSSTKIDLENSNIIWEYDLDFYSYPLDNILIEDSMLIITHYTYNYNLKEYQENKIEINKNTGELINYKKNIDTLGENEITNKEIHYKNVNRSLWPASFKTNPKYEIEIKVENKSLFRHKTDYHYTLELKVDDEILFITLDHLNINHIMYYLIYSNELYIVFSPNPKVITELKNTIYKIDLDKIITEH